jgi:hypothetical protein
METQVRTPQWPLLRRLSTEFQERYSQDGPDGLRRAAIVCAIRRTGRLAPHRYCVRYTTDRTHRAVPLLCDSQDGPDGLRRAAIVCAIGRTGRITRDCPSPPAPLPKQVWGEGCQFL